MGIAKIHASVTDLKKKLGIGCRTVGRAVTSDIRGPRLKPLLSAIITYNLYLHTVNCLKDVIKEKEAGNEPFLEEAIKYWALGSCLNNGI